MRRRILGLLVVAACAPHGGETMVGDAPTVFEVLVREVSRRQLPEVTPLAPEAVPPDATIQMERTGCFGSCPSYTVTLHADGTVDWQGGDDVDHEEGARWRISPYAFARLWTLVHAYPLADLEAAFPDAYCQRYSSCGASTHTTIASGVRSRRLDRYSGCSGHEGMELVTLFDEEIDRVAGTASRIGAGGEG